MKRKYDTAAERAEVWERWKRGEGLIEIGRALGRRHSSLFELMMPTGGIRPPPQRRSARSLTLAEREEISRGVVAGRSARSIARALARSPSTIM